MKQLDTWSLSSLIIIQWKNIVHYYPEGKTPDTWLSIMPTTVIVRKHISHSSGYLDIVSKVFFLEFLNKYISYFSELHDGMLYRLITWQNSITYICYMVKTCILKCDLRGIRKNGFLQNAQPGEGAITHFWNVGRVLVPKPPTEKLWTPEPGQVRILPDY